MLAVLLFSALVGTAFSQGYPGPGKDVKIVAHPKAVEHQEARHVHHRVPVLKQVPVQRVKVHTVVDEVPRIIRRPRPIYKTRVIRQYYPVHVPHVRVIKHIKPVLLEKKVAVPRKIIRHVPFKVVRTKTVKVPIDVPVPQIETRHVVKYKENRIFRPKPVVKEHVQIIEEKRPFPVDQHVVQKIPKPVVEVVKKPVVVVQNIHHHKKQVVGVPHVKTVAEVVPNVVHQKVTYPVGKGRSVQVGGGPVPLPEFYRHGDD
uniref:Putative mantle protein 10 n=1 Tax=Pinctada fucata TaxID=50426 RepID=A0A194AM43_PINFU